MLSPTKIPSQFSWDHSARIKFQTHKHLIFRIIPSEIEDRFKEIIKQITTFREENNVIRNDFLDIIKELKHGKEAFTNDDVAGQCASFFIDGFGTSSMTLNFIVFDLANNPWAQLRLREEIDSIFTKYNNELTYEAIQSMTFLDNICSGKSLQTESLISISLFLIALLI